jgi:hypothetical protein
MSDTDDKQEALDPEIMRLVNENFQDLLYRSKADDEYRKAVIAYAFPDRKDNLLELLEKLGPTNKGDSMSKDDETTTPKTHLATTHNDKLFTVSGVDEIQALDGTKIKFDPAKPQTDDELDKILDMWYAKSKDQLKQAIQAHTDKARIDELEMLACDSDRQIWVSRGKTISEDIKLQDRIAQLKGDSNV